VSSSSPDVVEARAVPRGAAVTALPNLLSLFRIAIVPVVMVLLMWTERGPRLAAAICFMIACITDYFDGWLARRRHSTTVLGQFLDPLADKLLVVSVLIMLVAMPCGTGLDGPCVPRVPAWLVVLIVGRELAVTGLRSMASSEGITLGAEELGKYKTIFQIFALTGLLLHYHYVFIDFHLGGMYFLWIAFVMGMWSAVDYHRRVYREVRALHRVRAANVDRSR